MGGIFERKLLTIACSTFGDRVPNAAKLLFEVDKMGLAEAVVCLVSHQLGDSDTLENEFPAQLLRLIDDGKVRYLPLSGKGLTKSRNCALDNCDTQYMWVVDDDLEIFPDAVVRTVRSGGGRQCRDYG